MSPDTKPIYEFDSFRLDPAEQHLVSNGKVIPLPPKAFELLLVMVEHAGHLVEKGDLLKAVWPETFVEESNLTSYISHLRKALGENGNGLDFIETVPKRGYRFVADVREVLKEERELTVQGHPESVEPLVKEQLGSQEPAKARKRRLAQPIVFVTLAVVIGVSVWLTLFRHSPRLLPPKIVPFTAFRGNERQPSFSPDGNQIAFVWDGEKEDNPDIYVKQLGNESLHRLTTNPAADTRPCWSPDGRFIAFTREVPEGSELHLIPSLGGAERRITQLSSVANIDHYQTSWSPDSKWLAVSDRGSIFLVARDTDEKRKLTSPPSTPNGDGSPAISPDGKTVAFFRNFDLYRVPTADGAPKLLVPDPGLRPGLLMAAKFYTYPFVVVKAS